MKLSNTELILLILINEHKVISGYRVNTIIEKYGYRQWAGIGTTSIYVGLKNLEKKGLTVSKMDYEKITKGPVGKIFSINKSGKQCLFEELRKGLSKTREHDTRFKIAISGMDSLEKAEIIKLLMKRNEFLENKYKELKHKFHNQKNEMVFKAEVLFNHTFAAIKNEMKFTEELSNQISKRREKK